MFSPIAAMGARLTAAFLKLSRVTPLGGNVALCRTIALTDPIQQVLSLSLEDEAPSKLDLTLRTRGSKRTTEARIAQVARWRCKGSVIEQIEEFSA
jgi:hypothetical protein